MFVCIDKKPCILNKEINSFIWKKNDQKYINFTTINKINILTTILLTNMTTTIKPQIKMFKYALKRLINIKKKRNMNNK